MNTSPITQAISILLSVALLIVGVQLSGKDTVMPPVFNSASLDSFPLVSQAKSAKFSEYFVSSRQGHQVHAVSLVELDFGQIRAFWFSGSREGARDVQIRSALFDPVNGVWSREQVVVDRLQTQRSLWRYIKKLGNPVVVRCSGGVLRLFYVTVSLGGWATSSISVISSSDNGVTWTPSRRLITSPFLNVSTLVKGVPYHYSDGGIGVPVYHELLFKFGEIIRLDAHGSLLEKIRITKGATETLQPTVFIESSRRATALMRYAGAAPKRVIMSRTDTAGRRWSPAIKTELANPNSAIAGLALAQGDWLLALNNQEQGRDTLSLMISDDLGNSWDPVFQLEDQSHHSSQKLDREAFIKIISAELVRSGLISNEEVATYAESIKRAACVKDCRFHFSYPDLLQASNGDIHVAYTYNKAFIKHVVFSAEWLAEQRLP